MTTKKVLKKIESEKEYKEQLKVYKKRIGKLFRTGYKCLANPDKFLKEFDTTLDEMVFINLVTQEYANNQRKRLYRELNKPQEFKSWLDDSIGKIKSKVKSQISKENIKKQSNKIKKIVKNNFK